uniref:PL48 domain-containing protein n=1 Tax=Globodera pallida TaxID=36090 RepID=A0A183BMA5_GLOPA
MQLFNESGEIMLFNKICRGSSVVGGMIAQLIRGGGDRSDWSGHSTRSSSSLCTITSAEGAVGTKDSPSWLVRSQSVANICSPPGTEREAEEPCDSLRGIRATMSAIEAEACGMLGRLQFDVQAIVGFARLCAGDVFEVVVKHGHQRWRSRGKTLADKSQRWEQRTVTMDVLWNVPVVVKVLEMKFLKSRCLNERQFDPAKFALAQPQLVTMNLNNVGSIKLRLVVTWLPLLSTKAMVSPQHGRNSTNEQSREKSIESGNSPIKLQPRTNPQANGSWQNENASQHSLPPMPSKEKKADENGNGEQLMRDRSGTESADGTSVKVCLRDKKRQREQRIQLGNSVAACSNFALDKEKWRCSSTTLLDDVYKDLAKSIPTIDDLTALNPTNFAPFPSSPRHRSFASESGHGKKEEKNPRRIFSFVKRGQSEASADQKKDWRKSASLGQIATSKDEQFLMAPLDMAKNSSTTAGKRSKPSSLKKGRNGAEGLISYPSSSASSSSLVCSEEPPRANGDQIEQQQNALKTAEALLAQIERIRSALAKSRGSSEFTELVSFEAAMLNWELNRAALMCQLEAELNGTHPSSVLRRHNGGSAGLRNGGLSSSPNNRASLYQLQNGISAGLNSPSTASDETDESAGTGGNCHQHRLLCDQISENDSGIDSLRQYQSPYNATAGNVTQKQFSDRRKSLGAFLELNVEVAGPANGGTAASGNAESPTSHSESPFEYTLSKMLYRVEGIETIALETMLALVQNAVVQCQPSAENVLATLGAESRVRDCWLTLSRPLGAFLLLPSRLLRAQLLKLCEPIVRARYPNDRFADVVFQFVGLFRGKSFVAFVENISHEASGQASAIRSVMDRLRGVPVVPPLESLRHIALVLSSGETQSTTGPIEKYLRKASPELQMDLTACFLCLLEHKDTLTRCGACRALAILRRENSMRCLDFLSRSDAQAQVRLEAKRACSQIQRIATNLRVFCEATKI